MRLCLEGVTLGSGSAESGSYFRGAPITVSPSRYGCPESITFYALLANAARQPYLACSGSAHEMIQPAPHRGSWRDVCTDDSICCSS